MTEHVYPKRLPISLPPRPTQQFEDTVSPKELVYFVEGVGTGLVKIGYSGNVRHRMDSLQAVSPVELRLLAVLGPADRTTEIFIHHQVKEHQTWSEWFKAEPVLALLETFKVSPPNFPDKSFSKWERKRNPLTLWFVP